jgi:hypothetical protein
MTKKQTEELQAEPQPQQAAEAAPSLTLQDLILVAQVIQLTSQRGAYRAEELQNVGALYNKLIAFLDSVGAITKPDDANTEK